MALMFNGIGVSKGIGIGEVHLLHRNQVDVTERQITKKQIASECRRLRRAIKNTKKKLLDASDNIPVDAPEDVSAFIETHILMLDDGLLTQTPIDIIKTEQINAEAALQQQREALGKVFDSMDDQYLATRIDDVNHVIDAVLQELVTHDKVEEPSDWKGQIVVAKDLTPADTVSMQHHGVVGFITETGGQLSHTAILARSLGIPAIVGVHNIRQYVKNGETLTLDGSSGMVLAEPSSTMLSDLDKRRKSLKKQQRKLNALIDTPAITKDGIELSLSANIEIEEDLKAVKRVNANGVGLYRTEFLFLNRDTVPTEKEHFKVYKKVLRALKGAPLTIRTADLGSDKLLSTSASTANDSALGQNPAMGLRGIRLSLNEPTVFLPQLRAILRASSFGPVRMLLPMLTSINEVLQVKSMIETIKTGMREENIEFDEAMPIGGMIEVPAAAIAAAQFAEVLDFLSIGTNDLIQYSLAIDRLDDQVDYLYDPLHPAVLQLIKHTIDAGAEADIPVTLCGEMGGDSRFVRLLLGLGLSNFSMQPNSLLEVKESLISSRRAGIKKSAMALLKTSDKDEQQRLLKRINKH